MAHYNKIYIKRVLCIIGLAVFVASAAACYAQSPTIVKSSEIVRINGKVYYVHLVKKGETLYSLARAYEVTISQLAEDNPELETGVLKAGQSLKILATAVGSSPYRDALVIQPSPPSTVTTQAAATTSETSASSHHHVVRPYYHEVKQGETLWGIAHKYGVTLADMRRYNPETLATTNDIMIGALLRLPAPSGEEHSAEAARKQLEKEFLSDHYLNLQTSNNDPVLLSRPVQAALLLPLLVSGRYIDDSETVNTAITTRLSSAEPFYSFYGGALLAIEDLKRKGLSLDLSVYDTYSEQTIKDLLEKKTLQGEDLIVGPVFAANFRSVAQFARDYNIKIVSPLDPNTEVLTVESPGMFQISPPFYCRQKKLIDDFLTHRDANMVLIYEPNSPDSLLVESYKDLLGDRFLDVTMLPYSVEAKNNTSFRTLLSLWLTPERENCVLVASNNEALVSDVAAHLYLLAFTQQHLITLYGLEGWRNFETIDLKYFHALNLHMVVPFFIDYSDEKVKNFVARFHETYKTDPSQYAFQGYDTFFYFLQAMMLYGKNFEKYLTEYTPKLLQTNYKFKYNESYNNGLVNVESCLINYTPDYTIVKR